MCGGAIISDFIPPRRNSKYSISASDIWPDSAFACHPNPPKDRDSYRIPNGPLYSQRNRSESARISTAGSAVAPGANGRRRSETRQRELGFGSHFSHRRDAPAPTIAKLAGSAAARPRSTSPTRDFRLLCDGSATGEIRSGSAAAGGGEGGG
ncbi:uncharacterized protein A4U43_C08F32640 [Asparagus officinalis]|nr:uncharacterized protein A4U43_C08F32640 [Asparagus officinalis]